MINKQLPDESRTWLNRLRGTRFVFCSHGAIRFRQKSGLILGIVFCFFMLLSLNAPTLQAAEGEPDLNTARAATAQAVTVDEHSSLVEISAGLAVFDWVIVFVYAASTILLGWYFSRRQKNTSEYFIGNGRMNPILIGVSLFATLLSTVSYLAIPGEILGKGPLLLAESLGLPIVFYIVGYCLLPVYMQQRVTSAYELLEMKLGLGIRLLGAVMFMILRLVWMSLLIYLTAYALTTILSLPKSYIPAIVLVTSIVSITYTSLGGLRAVVITDLIQTILLFSGALMVIAMVSWKMGGFGWFPTQWDPNWDTQPLFSPDPGTRVTFVGTIVSMVIWFVATSGGDQVSVQRFMSTRDVSAARRSLAIQLSLSLVIGFTLAMVGFSMLGYFQAFPSALPAHMDLKTNADDIFPFMISHQLPMGISGLVVAAMFAAAMSSIDSGVNSITAVVLTDFIDRLRKSPQSEKSHLLFARCLAFGIGSVVVVMSFVMGAIPGNMTAITSKTSNLLTTPLFCLFFFALFVPFAKPWGVWIGAICGTATAVLIAFSGPIFGYDEQTGLDPISFQWIAPAALAVNIATGSLISLMIPNQKKETSA
tara:strand:+ start:3828 stop:5603 length:1776 start_codon:yes stop_codon:yes gene_type:complete